MLGKIHGSKTQFYVPRLNFLGTQLSSRMPLDQAPHPSDGNLFSLDWDAVDTFKRNLYIKNSKFSDNIESHFPITLPAYYDDSINRLVFSIPHEYRVEVEHFTSIYYSEAHRVRHFDTVIREMCYDVAKTAINCAFKLLADCVYDTSKQMWFRSDDYLDKRLIKHLLMYKFWRELTGSGLVWDHAELDDLERSLPRLKENCKNDVRPEPEDWRQHTSSQTMLQPESFSMSENGKISRNWSEREMLYRYDKFLQDIKQWAIHQDKLHV